MTASFAKQSSLSIEKVTLRLVLIVTTGPASCGHVLTICIFHSWLLTSSQWGSQHQITSGTHVTSCLTKHIISQWICQYQLWFLSEDRLYLFNLFLLNASQVAHVLHPSFSPILQDEKVWGIIPPEGKGSTSKMGLSWLSNHTGTFLVFLCFLKERRRLWLVSISILIWCLKSKYLLYLQACPCGR